MKQFKMHCQYPLRHSNNDGVYMPADVKKKKKMNMNLKTTTCTGKDKFHNINICIKYTW